jgi:hypothetical protein
VRRSSRRWSYAADDEAVRAELALRLLIGKRAVRRAEAPAAPNGVRDQEHHAGIGRGGTASRRREAERLLERLDLAAERRRQDAVDLRERAVDDLRALRPGAGREQPEHDGHRLLVAEHQRRQPVAGPDPVAAAHAPLPLDGNPEPLEHVHVPPHRPRVDPEPVGDLPARRELPPLEELEELEQS